MPPAVRRTVLFLMAYARLLRIQKVLIRGGFAALQSEYLLPWKVSSRGIGPGESDALEIERAVNWACAWQFRRTVCLHRAVLAYSLLRAYGARPQFVMGVACRPFGSHAWVELEGKPIADREMDDARYHYRRILKVPADPAETKVSRAPTHAAAAAGA
jgi:hypothetical protein